MQQGILTDEQYKDLAKKIVNSIETKQRIVPLNSLKHPQYRLRMPVHISLEIEEDGVVASFDDIEAFSYADTESEAINRLCEEIVEIYEDLQADRENLGPLPTKWLRYLEELIECK
jgi:hypothetical protein